MLYSLREPYLPTARIQDEQSGSPFRVQDYSLL